MQILRKKDIKIYPEKEFRNGSFSPSGLPQVYNCTGYRLLADQDDSPEHPITTQGKLLHSVAEKRIKIGWQKRKVWKKLLDFKKYYKIGDPPEYDFVGEYVKDAVQYRNKNPSAVGVEIFVSDVFYSDLIGGYIDFIGYDREKRTLNVWDLKTGLKPTIEDQKYQLYFYALGGMNYFRDYNIRKVTTRFYTRYGMIERDVSIEQLREFKRHVSEKIRRMKFDVGNHCKDCYHFKSCKPAQEKVKSLVLSRVKQTDMVQWREIYKYKPLITKYFDFVEKKVLEAHYKTRKKQIGPFEVYETPGRRNWVRDKIPFILENMPELTEKVVKPISVKKALDKGIAIDNLWELKKTKKVKLTTKE